eukprot:CCRYP_010171-RA/>CCRYP_010171-RA protein AED:0.34 eAED:0.25 QI:0/0/0/1/0/0/2/0/539
MPINGDNGAFAWFMIRFKRQCNDDINHFCCLTNSRLTHSESAFRVQVDRPDQLKKVNDPIPFLESMICPDKNVIYKKEGRNSLVKVLSYHVRDGILTFNVQFPDGSTASTTREFLHQLEQPEIANILVTTEDYRNTASVLSDEELDKLAHPQSLNPQEQEFLDVHHRLFHLPYVIMFWLAKLGVLPKHFARLIKRPPPCASCMFGMAHQKPWQTKSTKDGKTPVLCSPAINRPGQCVAVVQIVSAQPGLVPQDKGQMTRARIWGCTVFVNYATSLVNVILMRDLGIDSTLAAKQEFENRCATKGIKIEQYHAENGQFADPAWKEDCKLKNQKLTFCGVGAHHQNAIVERKIKDLTLTARTLLLHAMRFWPKYISQILWPFAIKCAEDRISNLHWEPRAQLGIYLGHSPAHAGSVALVMNPKTGLVSPQFHVAFDDTFSRVPHIRAGTIPPNWEQLVRNLSELVTDENYDLSRTWFDGINDPSDDSAPTNSSSSDNTLEAQSCSIPSKGVHKASPLHERGPGPYPDSTSVSERDNKLKMP